MPSVKRTGNRGMNMLPVKRSGRLPASYMRTAWWIYRNPLASAGLVAGAFAMATLLGASLGRRR